MLWDKLHNLYKQATREVIIASPYIKAPTLSKLIKTIPDGIKIQCITRWQASEIALGINDLEAYDIIIDQGGTFFHHPTLHAKYYRSDNDCLIGSANLTATALGKSSKPNLELLEPFPFSELKPFETLMLNNSIVVDEKFRSTIAHEAEEWKKNNPDIDSMIQVEESNSFPLLCWLPQEIEKLYAFHLNQYEEEDIQPALMEAITHDLEILQIPHNLSQEDFKKSIAIALRCLPIVDKVEELSRQGGISKEIGQELIEKTFDSYNQNAWNVLCGWLITYLNYDSIDGLLYKTLS